MNFSDYQPARPSPRRELQLQGPRPTPLKVSKDSYKIKKPPMGPPPSHPPAASTAVPVSDQQPRPPVIIYTVSPKVIHTNPTDFMALVQRLTGPSATDDDPSLPSPSASGAFSPAARLATYERTSPPKAADYVERTSSKNFDMELDQLGIGGGTTSFDRQTSHHHGILSPIPSSLPSIPSNFFSSSGEAQAHTLGFQYDQQSPAGFHGSKSFVDNTFLVSPNNGFLSSPALPSPSSYWDLFNQYQGY